MGKSFIDQFSYLHIASGIVAYFWGLSFRQWMILHLAFEFIENTPIGVRFIDNYVPLWPGGKRYPDTLVNTVGDNVFAGAGWLSAWYIDHLYPGVGSNGRGKL
jgi:hypothetical protein